MDDNRLIRLEHAALVGEGREIPMPAENIRDLVAEIRSLRAALAAATARAEAAEKDANELNNQLDVVAQRLMRAEDAAKTKTRQIIILRGNAEAAAAKLAAVDKYASYYHDAITDYECGGPRQPLDYAEWMAQQGEVKP